jgi:tetratricopeptide (TPR) repeat protein
MLSKNFGYIVGVLAVILIAITIDVSGQGDDISIYGVVRDHSDNKKIANVDIFVYEDGKKIFDRKTNLNGKYEFVLDFNRTYKIVYNYPNYVSKYLTIDATDIPEKDRIGGFEMNIDMTLFEEIDGLDVSILEEPIGKANFDNKRGEMSWDMAYTDMMQKKIKDLMRRHDEKLEEEIEKLDKMHDNFDNLVRLGDAGMKNQKYETAVGYYSEALSLIPDDEVVVEKLDQAQKAATEVAATKEKKQKYNDLIRGADGYYNRSEWNSAITAYQSAGKLFPEEEYPPIRIKAIQKKLNEERNMAKVAAQVMALLQEADRLVAIEEYDDGIAKYLEVLSLESNNEEAKRKLIVAREKREAWLKQQELEAQYDEFITKADKLFLEENYVQAINDYRSAGSLKPSESYPPDQIGKAEEYLSLAKAEEAKENSFNEFVAKGDANVSKDEYQAGISDYNQALGIFPDDKAVKSKIKDAEAKLAALLAAQEAERKQKELDDEFANFVQEGDNSFSTKNYNDAIGFYQQALKIKKGDAEVEAKIEDARNEMKNMQQAKQVDEQYTEAIRKADKAFNNEDYNDAIGLYQQSLTLKKDEDYPKNKLTEIDAILAKMAADDAANKQKAIDDEFNALVSEGDEFVRKEDYNMGINAYENALDVKPGNEPVLAKIKDARAKQKEKIASLALDDQYATLINDADKLFRSQSWESSKNKYNEAYQVKNEQYPLDKIAEIDLNLAALAEEARNNAETEKLNKFNKLEKEGDNAITLAEYSNAISKYDEALQIISDNQRVIDKKDNASKLLSEANANNEIEERYNQLISNADSEFDNESYSNSRKTYQLAINIKPNEAYPKNQIDKIDVILLELENKKAIDKKAEMFASLELAGDKKVEQKLYPEAIDKYEQALEILPDEIRVQQKINDARILFEKANSNQEIDDMYNEFITKADAGFNAKDYEDAKGKYQQAYSLKPLDYPKNQIKEIDRILLGIERQKVQDEAERLARMRKEEKSQSWDEDITEEEKYIIEAKNIKEEDENLKYEDLLAYKKALKNTQDNYKETGDSNRSGNALIINEEKQVSDLLYNDIKLEDDQRQVSEIEMVKEMDKRWVKQKTEEQNERIRMSYGTVDYEDYNKKLQTKHREVILNNYNTSQKAKEIRYTQFSENEDIRQRNIDEINELKKGVETFYKINNDKQQQHIDDELKQTQSIKQTQSKDIRKGYDLAATNLRNLESEKELRALETKTWEDKANLQRSLASEEVNSMKWPGEKKPYEYYPKEKSQTHQQGVTEQVMDEGKNKVIYRTVILGNKVDEYKMVVTNHGTYYFKNGDSISKNTWNINTENVAIED